MIKKTLLLLTGAALVLAGTAGAATSLNVVPGAAMNGTTQGMEITFDGAGGNAFVQDQTPNDESVYRAAFWFNPNSITMADGTFHVILRATSEAPFFGSAVQILFIKKSGLCRTSLRGLNNSTAVRFTTRINIPCDSASKLQVEWQQSPTPGTLGGDMTLTYLEGSGPVGSSVSSSLNNSNVEVDSVNLGAMAVAGTTTGSQYFDEFESFRTLAP